MSELLTPLESKTIEQDRENLEVVVLLVTYYVDHLIDGEILETHLGSTDVLSHINTGSIATKQELLVETLVGKVGPYRIILMALEESFSKTLLYLSLTLKVCLALVVDFIE